MGTFHVSRTGSGKAQYHPRMMLGLLVYCYASGIFSSRRIEQATYRNVSVRFIAANTHPETYPKYQVQLGRVVLLRDMINWCLEHPVRAKPMPADDPRMRAMEAYIFAARKGKSLEYGKH